MDTTLLIAEIDAEIAKLTKVRDALQVLALPAKRGPGRPRVVAGSTPSPKKKAKRKMSAEGRARIAAAQKARWANAKK